MNPQRPDEHREELSAGSSGGGASGGGSSGEGESSGRDSETGGGDGGGRSSLDEVDVKDLLRMALDTPQGSSKRIAEGVHRKISKASGGRYFADGWSTSTAPRATFIVTSLLMLVVIVLAWLVLLPWGMGP